MLEKAHLHETFFGLKGVRDRPVSVATEFMESDWDDDEILSDVEGGENSPRDSVNSVSRCSFGGPRCRSLVRSSLVLTSLQSGQPSITTLSSYDEVQTPRSSRAPTAFQVDADAKPVEGPRGPHLFRSSMLSANSIEYQNALTLSPIAPKTASKLPQTEYQLPIKLELTVLPRRRRSGPFRFSDAELTTHTLAEWSPEMVAQWMLNAGVELPMAEKFVENDITGGILITLKFEDLKELGIPSFGNRTKIWEEIHIMRNIQPSEPDPETPIEDEPDTRVCRELKRMDCDAAPGKPPRRRASSRRKKPKLDDVISPLESVSIVGIEQVIPKPHHCSKGENCDKYRKRQRLIDDFKREHPFADIDKGGMVMVAGNPGNPETAKSITLAEAEDAFRPSSDAIPSIVASSDVMGPGGIGPFQYLHEATQRNVQLREATLRNVQLRDPQDNVRQFLDFQHQHGVDVNDVPMTPPFDLAAHQRAAPHGGLRALPKLAIPGQAVRNLPKPASAHPLSAVPVPAAAPYNPYAPAAESSPDLTPTAGLYRFASPFSEMDVPLTAVPLGPIARDASQSVPPDMNYRTAPNPPPRSQSRASARRPSFHLLQTLDENMATPVAPRRQPHISPRSASRPPVPALPQPQQQPPQQRPLQPPPRFQYPWTSERTSYEKAIAPMPAPQSATSSNTAVSATSAQSFASGATKVGSPGAAGADDGVTYAGPMKKRKTRMLRHEWNEHFFTLRGTRLAMHKSARAVDRTLEYVDIDDYAVACSSLASTSKLNAAFKAMSLSRRSPSDDADVAAFAFQLIPQDARGGVKLRKRDSSMSTATAAPAAAPAEGVNGTGKSHHFAVKSRDDRIDWMRELMLAKALKQKGAGFEVSVNGNMI